MTKKAQNTGFICENCGKEVLPIKRGTYRNHCPFCLHSKHVDNAPGDRGSGCMGLMKPAGTKISNKGAQILHKCTICGFERLNLLTDDEAQPDNYDLFLEVMKNEKTINFLKIISYIDERR